MSRFKGMYWRQFGISVGLVALTLVLLGASFFSLTYSYMMTERRVELEEKAEIIAQMAERAYSGSSAGLGLWSEELRDLVDRCNAISDRLTGCQCNICINYGGREEIVHAARSFARDCLDGRARPEDLTEEGFEDYLYSAGIPSPELLIRPGGEQRLSNFLLWQCAYAEFYYTNVLWPDFTKRELLRAIAA